MRERIARESWVEILPECDFTIDNFPFGVYRTSASGAEPRCCSAIGDFIIDLTELQDRGYFRSIRLAKDIFKSPSLNAFISAGKEVTGKVRERLIDLLSKENQELQSNHDDRNAVLKRRDQVVMILPVEIGDYTDFYSSKEHASNVGALFRDPANALLPNWRHLPVAYHGRASSIVISGTSLVRPKGQFRKSKDDITPVFGPTEALDYELELAFVIGRNSPLGVAIPVEQAENYIFGFFLFNDWSARDIQNWEYVPLGPFLSKNFMSSVSPWIVTTEALEPFRTASPRHDILELPYLQSSSDHSFDIDLEVFIQPEHGMPMRVSTSNFKGMYWNVAQQLAHHTVGGCNIRVGDVMASGTISGEEDGSAGCLLEMTRNGVEPVMLSDGTSRKFLHDGDTVIMRGFASREGRRIGFGEVTGKVLPAR